MPIYLIDKIAPKNNAFTGMVDSNQVISSGASGNFVTFGGSVLTDSGIAPSGLVPYVGANKDINLGSHSVTTTGSFYGNGSNLTGLVASFLGLTDTPKSYSGMAASGVRVNSSVNALEFYSTQEHDPVFTAWKSATPPLYEETDPIWTSEKSAYITAATAGTTFLKVDQTTPQTTTGLFTFPQLRVSNHIYFNTPVFNTIIGYNAGQYLRATSHDCVLIGYQAGNGINTVSGSANYNTAVGSQALYGNTTGDNNTAIGYGALQWPVTGNDNTAVGSEALNNVTNADQNTAVGSDSCHNVTTGKYNVALGAQSLYTNIGGSYNIAIGLDALYYGYGSSGIAIGSYAGKYQIDNVSTNGNTTDNIWIGNSTTAMIGDSNAIVIGARARSWGSNTITIGNDSHSRTILKGNVGIGTPYPVDYALEINRADGNCVRLIYNNSLGSPSYWASLGVSPIGALEIVTSGSSVTFGTSYVESANLTGYNTGDQDLSGYSLTSHLHPGVYEPVRGINDFYVTGSEKYALASGFLRLDQSTPQEITGGFFLTPSSSPVSKYAVANKHYVDVAVSGIVVPAEEDPVFEAWLSATPPLYVEVDPTVNTSQKIQNIIGPGVYLSPSGDGSHLTGIVTAHSALTGLDYISSGHTGFQPSGNYLSPSGSAALLTSFPTLNQSTTGNASTVTNGVYTTDVGVVFLSPSGNGINLTGVVHVETDPIVGAINGIVKANGTGVISAAASGIDFVHPSGDGSHLGGVIHTETDPVFEAWKIATPPLYSYTETDPVVGSINGIVKSDGAGNISQAVSMVDYYEPSAALIPSVSGVFYVGDDEKTFASGIFEDLTVINAPFMGSSVVNKRYVDDISVTIPHNFIDLLDVPVDYVGMEASGVRVNALGNGLEFYATFTEFNLPDPGNTYLKSNQAVPQLTYGKFTFPEVVVNNSVNIKGTTIGTNTYGPLEVHTPSDNYWTAAFYTDAYSSTIPNFTYYGYNNGKFAMGTEVASDLAFYTTDYAHERMVIKANGDIQLPLQTSNGFVKFTGSNGTLGVDTNSYLTAPVASGLFVPYIGATSPVDVGDFSVTAARVLTDASNITTGVIPNEIIAGQEAGLTLTTKASLVVPITPYCIDVDGVGYSYIVYQGPKLLKSYNITAELPVEAGSIATPSFPSSVSVNGNTAFVTTVSSGSLCAYSIATPSSLSLISSIATSENAYGLFVLGSYAYVATLTYLRIYDVSNTSNMQPVGNVAFGSGYASTPHSIWVKEILGVNYAFVALSSYLKIYDVSNVSSPALVATINLSNPNSVRGWTNEYGTNYLLIPCLSPNAFYIYDISNPSAPSFVSSTSTQRAGYPASYPSDVSILRVSGEFGDSYNAYIPMGDSRAIEVYDITSASTPYLLARGLTGGENSNTVSLYNNYVYVPTMTGNTLTVHKLESAYKSQTNDLTVWKDNTELRIAGLNGYGIFDAFDYKILGSPIPVSHWTNDSGYISSFTETDPLSLHLSQSSPQTFTSGSVTGTGLLKVTSGTLGLDTTVYSTAASSSGLFAPITEPLSLHLSTPNQTVNQVPTFASGIRCLGYISGYDGVSPIASGIVLDMSHEGFLKWVSKDPVVDTFDLMGFSPATNTLKIQTLKGANGIVRVSNLDGSLEIDPSSYLTYETDPVFVASPAHSLSAQDIIDIGNLSGLNTGDQTLSSLGAEASGNKVIALSAASTNVQYPSAKLVYDQLALKASNVDIFTGVYADSPLHGSGTFGSHLTVDLSSKQDADPTLSALALLDTTTGLIRQTGIDAFTKDTNTYLTSLTGAVLTSQATPQTIGATATRLAKLWATDITCTNSITGSITGSSASCTGNSVTSTKLAATKNINGVAFDGSADILVPSNIAPGSTGNILTSNGSVWTSAVPATNGTVTSVSVISASGIAATISNQTTTPAISLTLGNISPISVNTLTFTPQSNGFTIRGGTTSKTLTVPLDATVSGTNTGDQSLAGLINGVYASGSFAPISEPLSMHLDQTTPQNITGGQPSFAQGLNIGSDSVSWGSITAGGIVKCNSIANVDTSKTAMGIVNRYLYKKDGTTVAFDFDLMKFPSLTTNGFLKTSSSNGTLIVDTNSYLTSLTGAVLTDQTTGQTIGNTTNRLTKLWATDVAVTNAITGSVTGNAGTVTNGVYTTGAGTVYLTPTGSAASLTNFPTLNQDTTGQSGYAVNLRGGNSSTWYGSIWFQGNLDFSNLLAPNRLTTRKFLTQTGTGTNGNAPAWNSIDAGDVPTLNQNTSGSSGSCTGNSATVTGLSITAGQTLTVTTGGTLGTGAYATIGNYALVGQTMYIGTTAVAINRNSASLALTGITSIDGASATCSGNASTATTLATSRTINGILFNGGQNIVVPSDITPGTSGNLMISNGTLWTSSAAPTWNQSTTGSAATLTTSRNINGVAFNGSADITVPSNITPSTSGNLMISNGSLWTSAAAPTWNQSTTGTASAWTTARLLAGNSVTGAANVAFANKFIVQGTTDTGLSNAQFTGALATGLVKNTVTTGILSIATQGSDYYAPSGTDVAVTDGGTGLSAVAAGSILAAQSANTFSAVTATTGVKVLTNSAGTISWQDTAQPINAQIGTTYTFALTDAQKLVTLSNASPIAVTIPTEAVVAFPVGTRIDCIQKGTGKVTFSGAGVTINSSGSLKSINGQYVGVTLFKESSNTWYLVGNLVA